MVQFAKDYICSRGMRTWFTYSGLSIVALREIWKFPSTKYYIFVVLDYILLKKRNSNENSNSSIYRLGLYCTINIKITEPLLKSDFLEFPKWFCLAVDEHFSPFNWYFATFRTFCLAHSNNFDERVIFSHLVLVHS